MSTSPVRATPPTPSPRNRQEAMAVATQGIRSLWSRAAKVATPIGAVGGFCSDVLAPLGPLVRYAFGLGVLMTALSAVIWFGIKRRQVQRALADGHIDARELDEIKSKDVWSVSFAASAVITVILGLFFGAQTLVADEGKGVFATEFPAIAEIQATLFRLDQKTTQIAATTDQIDRRTEDMQKSIQAIEAKVAQAQANPAAQAHYDRIRGDLPTIRAQVRKETRKEIDFAVDWASFQRSSLDLGDELGADLQTLLRAIVLGVQEDDAFDRAMDSVKKILVRHEPGAEKPAMKFDAGTLAFTGDFEDMHWDRIQGLRSLILQAIPAN